jgi:hypothetical protein
MERLKFANFLWEVRQSSGQAGPGPNLFDKRNVSLLSSGVLRLDVTQRDGAWTCAELSTIERLGLGTYQFQLVGRPDLLDPQLVFGFFPYPPPDVGPDGTHELDIEFARWGERAKPCGNYTVCPTTPGKPATTHPFPLALPHEHSTHRIVRRADRLIFSSYSGHRQPTDQREKLSEWEFSGEISRAAMPLHLNFWLFRGKAPQNGKSASLTLKDIQFIRA